MQIIVEARQVADYVLANWKLPKSNAVTPLPVSENVAAILVDAVFQAGLNYQNVVFPRVCAVANAFPNMRSLEAFQTILTTQEFSFAIGWNHPEKPKRLRQLVSFLINQGLSSVEDIKSWLTCVKCRELLRSVRGIGYKTIDYLSRLVGLPVIAVDRHANRLLREVGIVNRGYREAKRILEFAADLLNINRWLFDQFIWEKLRMVS